MKKQSFLFVVALAINNRFRVFVGTDAKIMDFFYRLTPKSAANMIGKKMGALLSNRVEEKQFSVI